MKNNKFRIKKIGLSFLTLFILVVVFSFSSVAADEFEKNLQKFPESYRPYLIELHEKYPDWVFEPFETGLDFNSTVDAQYGEASLVDNGISAPVLKSHDKDDYNINTGSYVYKDGGFVQASKFAVSYFLDPRNFLNEEGIFQFERLDFNEMFSVKAVELILKGSFMYDTKISYLDASGKKISTDLKYSQAIYNAGKKYNINPCYLASKILNEVGNDGSYSVWGNHSQYPGIYNFYNIGATDGTNAITRGLAWANGGADGSTKTYGRPWNTPEKSIMGGAQFLASSYIAVGQFTGYLQRFNVNPDGSYKVNTHQYMTNLTGAFSQGYTNYSSYAQLGIINNRFVFSIPVFRNMTDALPESEITAVDSYTQNGTVNASGLSVRSGPSTLHSRVQTSSGKNISLPKGTKVNIISKHFTDAEYYSRILQYPLWYYVSFTYESVKYTGYVYYEYIDISTVTNVGVGKYDINCFGGSQSMTCRITSDNPYICKVVDNDTVEFLKPGKVTLTVFDSRGRYDKIIFNVADSIGAYKISDMDVIADSESITVTVANNSSAKKYGFYLADRNGRFIASASVTTNTYTFKGLTADTDYTVYCRYIYKDGIDNGPVRSYDTSTLGKATPDTPVNIRLRDLNTKGYILSWDKSDADGYRIYRYVPEITKYIVLADVYVNEIFIDDLDSGYACAYRIKAFYNDGHERILSPYSERFWTLTPPEQPDKPLSTETTADSIKLQWNKRADTDTYALYLKGGKSDKLIYKGKDNFFEYDGVKGLSEYKFYVVAIAESRGMVSESIPSELLTVNTPAETVKGFTASEVTASSYKISWNKIPEAAYYRVYSVSDGLYTQVAMTEEPYCELTGLENSKKTAYVVTATYFVDDYVLESDRSKEFTATTLPDAVTGLKGTAYDDRVSLKWNKVKNADCYNVYLMENGKYVLKKTVKTNSYVLEGLQDATNYSVRVRAYIRSTLGTQKGKLATLSFNTKMKTVTNIKASNITDTTCVLSWSPSSKGANRYNVYRYDKATGKSVRIAYTTGATRVTLKNLKPGTTERFCIIAYIMKDGKAIRTSYKTELFDVKMNLGKVVGLKAKNSSAGTVTLTWNSVPYASYYRVYMYDEVDKKYVQLGTPKTTTFKVKSLKKGKSYKFKIRAIGRADGKAYYGYYSSVLTFTVKK